MFGSDKLNKAVSGENWDRVKIVCTQPFNKVTLTIHRIIYVVILQVINAIDMVKSII